MYEAYFGFATLPFRLAPDSRFYVDTPTHGAALHALQDSLARGSEFVSLIGDCGTGKTVVGRRLLQELNPSRQLGAELRLERIEGDDVFERVVKAFDLPRDKGVRPLENAIRQFEGLVREGRDALLLIDDAHRLDALVLRRLRKLTIGLDGRAALRVCLAGRFTPGFEELQRFSHPLGASASVRLEPMNVGETHLYILESLRRAGWQGRPGFEAAAATAIHVRCQGNPGRVNRLCGHILLHLYMQGRDNVTVEVACAVDDLLQAELRGEFATLSLPPPARSTAPATHASSVPIAHAALHGDALMARLLGEVTGTTSATPSAGAPETAPVAAPSEATDVPAHTARRARGSAWRITALALMVTIALL
jgi:type II secretory pathway predicted ATPase ExeA